MTKFSIFLTIIVLIASLSFLTSDVQAQGRRGHDRVRVVRPNHYNRVVRVHPQPFRPAHVRYTHLPRWGSVVSQRPIGTIFIASNQGPYYFHNGIYYLDRHPGFIIVRPVPGIRIKVLPPAHRRFKIKNRPYFYYYGTFYVKTDNREYEVVEAPEGAIVDALPAGYEVKKIGNNDYYVLDGVYYAEVDTDEIANGIGYQVVKI